MGMEGWVFNQYAPTTISPATTTTTQPNPTPPLWPPPPAPEIETDLKKLSPILSASQCWPVGWQRLHTSPGKAKLRKSWKIKKIPCSPEEDQHIETQAHLSRWCQLRIKNVFVFLFGSFCKWALGVLASKRVVYVCVVSDVAPLSWVCRRKEGVCTICNLTLVSFFM